MSEELKPCPFCGGSDVSPSSFDVKCMECGVEMPGGTERAIAAWNRRAPSPDMREAVEALTTAVHAHYVKAFEDYGIAREVLQADPEIYHGALDTIAYALTGAKP